MIMHSSANFNKDSIDDHDSIMVPCPEPGNVLVP